MRRISPSRLTGLALVIASSLILAFSSRPLHAQESSTPIADRFSYRGDMFIRGIYLARDLPLKSQSYNTTSRNREEQDFYSARLRLDLAFRASQYVDVLYGLEVGELTFGRDNASRAGPGSGGKGAGAANLETRELILKFRNYPESLSFSAGILNFDTPRGLVTGTSGAGAKFSAEMRALHSSVDAYYIRSEDNSTLDGDSNGFSDSNFRNVNMGLISWKFSGIPGMRSEFYGMYRQDDDPSLTAGDSGETSRVYWGGIFTQYKAGQFGLMLHGVGNWGNFWRPGAISTSIRKRYTINAGAGQYEVSWQFLDQLQVALVGAGASGRLGHEPNASSSEFRTDQFRTNSSAFQFTSIALDSSGGYTIFPGGKLTGIVAHGIEFRSTIFNVLQADFSAYLIQLYRSPVVDYNAYYTRYPALHRSDRRLGKEYDAKFAWRFLSDLTLEAKLAYFDADDGYRIINDVVYGDDMAEIQISATQKF